MNHLPASRSDDATERDKTPVPLAKLNRCTYRARRLRRQPPLFQGKEKEEP